MLEEALVTLEVVHVGGNGPASEIQSAMSTHLSHFGDSI